MITFFTTILSFLAGGLPKILDFFRDKTDKKHELLMMQMQFDHELTLSKINASSLDNSEEKELSRVKIETSATLQQEEISAYKAQINAIYNDDIETGKGASTWVINLRSSVRPVVAYCFLFIFGFIEIVTVIYGIKSGISLDKIVPIVWDESTQTIFSSIIAFYFGSRAFSVKR
jgi:hypothetical protein